MIQSNQYPVKVTTSDCEVIASGVVHLTEPEVKFEITNLVIKYKFVKDSEGTRYSGEVINGELLITLYNFNNSLGQGLLNPIEIGTLSGRPLLATCFVSTTEENLRQFHYTFMLRNE